MKLIIDAPGRYKVIGTVKSFDGDGSGSAAIYLEEHDLPALVPHYIVEDGNMIVRFRDNEQRG